jgi:hypothetical protein
MVSITPLHRRGAGDEAKADDAEDGREPRKREGKRRREAGGRPFVIVGRGSLKSQKILCREKGCAGGGFRLVGDLGVGLGMATFREGSCCFGDGHIGLFVLRIGKGNGSSWNGVVGKRPCSVVSFHGKRRIEPESLILAQNERWRHA